MRYAVIPAAGSGRRFGGKKQFFEINGRPIVEYSISVFQKSYLVDGIVLVLPEEDMDYGERFAEKYSKICKIVPGGSERQESVYRGLTAIENAREVIVHDGARPVIDTSVLKHLVVALSDYSADGVVLGIRPRDTVKLLGSPLERGDFFVEKTLDRDKLILVQTPQVFNFEVLLECHERARAEDFWATDDSALLERYGYTVVSIPGDYRNIKVTTKEDIEIVSLFVR